MIVRFATPDDTTKIIELLKDSLGESTIPKSKELWDWKHNHSPFGPSYVMLAEENGKLIGVRAFMQWKWQRDGIVYHAIRAVDTATHPDHQGKGIFKKLTLGLAAECQKQGVHFIFNTPNEQSRPGYLKMGWEQVGKMPLNFCLSRPFNLLRSILTKGKHKQKTVLAPSKWTNEVYGLLDKYQPYSHQLTTLSSMEYLSWRYGQNPLFDYHFITDNTSYLVVFRIKEHSWFDEMRITDFFVLDKNMPASKIRSDFKKQFNQIKKQTVAPLLTISAQQYQQNKKFIPFFKCLPALPVGPIVTVKDLNMKELFRNLLKVRNWGFSLGDMELF